MEKKDNIFKLSLILLIITAVAALILAFVYNITAEPIAHQKKLKNETAMKELISNGETFELNDVELSGNVLEVNEGKSSEGLVGYTLKMSTKGYGGLIELMVGISVDGNVTGIKVLTQAETPGLGANATLPSFTEQFKNKGIDEELVVVKSEPSGENEVQAITGATITTDAVASAVNEAIAFYKENLQGGTK